MESPSLSKLLRIRMGKERWIWILAVVCLILVILYIFPIIPSSLCEDTVHKINTIMLSMVSSYLIALVVYFLTVFLPTTRKAIVIIPLVVESVRKLMHKSEDLERDCYGGSWFKDTLDEITNGMFDKITGQSFDTVNDSELVKIKDEYAAIFLEYKNSIDVTLNILLTYEIYLTPSDCQAMTEIKFAFSTWQIGENFESVNTKRTLTEFIKDIIRIYKQIHYFDTSLSHYKYDFQKNLDTRNNQLN